MLAHFHSFYLVLPSRKMCTNLDREFDPQRKCIRMLREKGARHLDQLSVSKIQKICSVGKRTSKEKHMLQIFCKFKSQLLTVKDLVLVNLQASLLFVSSEQQQKRMILKALTSSYFFLWHRNHSLCIISNVQLLMAYFTVIIECSLP